MPSSTSCRWVLSLLSSSIPARSSRTSGSVTAAITVRCAPAESATVTVFTVAANAVHTSPRLPAVAATATMRGPAAASQRRICSCRFVMQKLLWFSVHTPGRTAKTKRTARTRPPVYQQKRTAPRAFLKTKTTDACGRGRPWYLCIIAKESRRVKFSASNRHFSIQLVIFYADFFFFAILSKRSAHASPRRRTLHVSPCANPDFYGIITPKAAVYTAARVQGTRPCADAQGFGNIEPCKTAAGAVLLWPLCGVMV